MPHFLTRDEVYRLLQRELPEGVYPDGAPSAFFSTADMDSVADVAATGYSNLNQVYNNAFPQTCDSVAIIQWERTVFGYNNDASLGLAARQARVVEQIQTRRGLTIGDMKAIVLAIIGTDKIVEIVPWCMPYGSWILDSNQLGITTWLGSGPRLQTATPFACELGAAGLGLTADQFAGAQNDAYSYSVLIYSYAPTALELAKLDQQLSIYEPARSKHYIFGGLDPVNQIFSPPFFIDGGSSGSVGVNVYNGGSSFSAGPDSINGGDSF